MLEKGSGSIINISTLVSPIHTPGISVCDNTLPRRTRTWAAEFGGFGVRVNPIEPGPAVPTPESDSVLDHLDAHMTTQVGLTTLLARLAAPRETAEGSCLLASDS